nr:MAG TPA: hypothetical protein [Caudoviricetes sp.]
MDFVGDLKCNYKKNRTTLKSVVCVVLFYSCSVYDI